MATWIQSDGSEQSVQPANGEYFTLKELQQFVGGYIEMSEARDGRIIIVDEEGKLKGKPHNQKATELSIVQFYGDIIVGDVLVCNHDEIR